MLFAGIVISAIAMFFGIVTKLPQGGGGLTNNLLVLSFFLPAPPLLPPPLQKRILFDLETAIAENQMYYLRNPVVTSNGTYGPMPRPLQTPPSAAGSSNASTKNATFTFSTFAFSAYSLPSELTEFWQSIGTTIMVLMALCLPWLIIKKMNPIGKTGPALNVASMPILTGFGELVAQIEPHDPLLSDLRMAIAQRKRVSADLWSTTKQAREAEKMAAERDAEKEEELKGLRAERKKTLEELEKEKKMVEKLEEERKREVAEKERKWEEERAEDKKRHVEALDSLNMAREREAEAWRRQVEDLEEEKRSKKEAFGAKLKNILERMKKEREGWGKEKEALKKEKEEELAAREKVEEMRGEEKKAWEESNDRAQGRIAFLEEETQRLKEKEAKGQKKAAEAEAEKEEGEKRSWEAREVAKNTIAKLEEEVLNGRKLIEDLQGDKRRDRQMLIELRAQLVRPTHAVPPGQINPLRFGGSTPRSIGAPFIAGSSALPPTFPSTAPRTFPIVDLPSYNPPPPTATPPPSGRPTVRLPPRPAPTPANLPAPTSPPTNAPQGPRRSH